MVEVEVGTVMLVDCGQRGVRMTFCVVAVWTTCLDGMEEAPGSVVLRSMFFGR